MRGLLERLAFAGVAPTDTEELRFQKATLTLAASAFTVFVTVWVVAYGLLGLTTASLIPAAYQAITVLSLLYLARTKRLEGVRFVQLGMFLLFPFLVHVSLGGFVASSAFVLWGMMAPLGVLIVEQVRRAVPWFVAYLFLVALAGGLEQVIATKAGLVPDKVIVGFFVLNIVGLSFVGFLALHFAARERARAIEALKAEQERTERILHQVLPDTIVERLKEEEGVIAERFGDVTVLFADIAGFTKLAKRIPPERLVTILDEVFSAFDRLVEYHGLEKIKTVGDAYMVAGGVPVPRDDHPEAVADLALAMLDEVEQLGPVLGHHLDVRIGMDTGPVVAGVIGQSRLAYDLWGDTVNTASQMQTRGVVGMTQVTARTYERLKDGYRFRRRRLVRIKGDRPTTTYLLLGKNE